MSVPNKPYRESQILIKPKTILIRIMNREINEHKTNTNNSIWVMDFIFDDFIGSVYFQGMTTGQSWRSHTAIATETRRIASELIV